MAGDMMRVSFVVCGDLDLADEAVAAAWLIAWRKLRTLREPDRIHPSARIDRHERGTPGGPPATSSRRDGAGDGRCRGRLGRSRRAGHPTSIWSTPWRGSMPMTAPSSRCATSPGSTPRNWPAPPVAPAPFRDPRPTRPPTRSAFEREFRDRRSADPTSRRCWSGACSPHAATAVRPVPAHEIVRSTIWGRRRRRSVRTSAAPVGGDPRSWSGLAAILLLAASGRSGDRRPFAGSRSRVSSSTGQSLTGRQDHAAPLALPDGRVLVGGPTPMEGVRSSPGRRPCAAPHHARPP